MVRACGAETEAELAFSALADLLEPVLGGLAALPAPQAAALRGALALGPPATGAPAPGDRLAVCVAALGVLRAAARQRPVLAVVDDLQWVDVASRECVEYAARRAGGSLAVVLAARDPWPARAGLPELRVVLDESEGVCHIDAPGVAAISCTINRTGSAILEPGTLLYARTTVGLSSTTLTWTCVLSIVVPQAVTCTQ